MLAHKFPLLPILMFLLASTGRGEGDVALPTPSDPVPPASAPMRTPEKIDAESDDSEAMLKPRYQIKTFKKQTKRTPASALTADVRSKPKGSPPRTQSYLDAEVLAGMGFLSTQDPTVSNNRSEQGMGKDYAIGLRVSGSFNPYLQAQIEVLPGITPPQDFVSSSGTPLTETKSQSSLQWSAVGLLSYPIREVNLQPKIGLGYGSISLSQSTTSPSDRTEVTSTLNTLFGRVGLSWQPTKEIELDGSFDLLLSGTNEIRYLRNSVAQQTADYPGGLTRFRFVGFYSLSEDFSAGLEFRSQQTDAKGAVAIQPPGANSGNTSPTDREAQLRVMALLRYRVL